MSKAKGAIPSGVREAVLRRADGRCEWCGRYQDPLELHHRRFRSRGGKHTVQNLVGLCGRGNLNGCHGKAHSTRTEAAKGFAVSQFDKRDESRIPVHTFVCGWVTLTPFGSVLVHERELRGDDENDA